MLATDRIHRRRLDRRSRSTKPKTIVCPRCGTARRVQFLPGPPPVYCSTRCGSLDRKRRARQRRRLGIPATPPRRAATPKTYASAWRTKRAAFLAEHPTCERPGCHRTATDVDHIIRRRTLLDLGVVDVDAAHRLVALCRYCHATATATFDGGFGNRLDEAGKLRWLGLPHRVRSDR